MRGPALRASLLLSLLLAAPAGATTYYVSPSGSDNAAGTSAAPWRSLQKAASTMVAGDTVLAADGDYAGGIMQTRAGTASAPITFRAVNPGKAVVRGDQTSNRDAIFLDEARYVVWEGFTVRNAIRAGMRLSLTDGVVVRRCVFANNGTWGIFTDYDNDTVLEYNECYGSGREHGIYVSNGGDRPLIRFNTVHDNNASGIQINADPLLIDTALGKRGDGITEGALVEGNIVFGNGTAGGASINLASVRGSRIANNLLYNNKAGGISGWDDGDGEQWGCKDNLILNNTVFFKPGEGRYCLSLKNGSTNNLVQNNILAGGARGSIEYDDDSSVVSDFNSLTRSGSTQVVSNEDAGTVQTLAQWQASSGNDTHSRAGDPRFASASSAPYDFHLQTGSPALDAGIARSEVPLDLEGTRRPGGAAYDLGCYERGTAAAARFRVAVFRTPTREWFLRADDGQPVRVQFGGPDDTPVPADYDGRHRAQVAVFRRTSGEWLLRGDAGELTRIVWGTVGDQPVPADYQGAGNAQVAVYRPSSGQWFLRYANGGAVIPWGGPGDVPVPGDYTGAGHALPAVFRPATAEWLIRNDNGTLLRIQWGVAGDLPVPGDYDGSGRTRIAVYRPATRQWFVRLDSGAQVTEWGGPGDVPVPGDYLGLGRCVVAVFRPTTREWFIRNADGTTQRIAWGGPDDVPLPAAYSAVGP